MEGERFDREKGEMKGLKMVVQKNRRANLLWQRAHYIRTANACLSGCLPMESLPLPGIQAMEYKYKMLQLSDIGLAFTELKFFIPKRNNMLDPSLNPQPLPPIFTSDELDDFRLFHRATVFINVLGPLYALVQKEKKATDEALESAHIPSVSDYVLDSGLKKMKNWRYYCLSSPQTALLPTPYSLPPVKKRKEKKRKIRDQRLLYIKLQEKEAAIVSMKKDLESKLLKESEEQTKQLKKAKEEQLSLLDQQNSANNTIAGLGQELKNEKRTEGGVVAPNSESPAVENVDSWADQNSGELKESGTSNVGPIGGEEVCPPLPVSIKLGIPSSTVWSLIAFHNFDEEMKRPRIWESDEGSSSTVDAPRDNLASLYRPPFNLMFQGPFEKAKVAASVEDKWLLVNLQSSKEFSSHMVYDDTSEGRKVCTYYKLDLVPVVLIINPITGQKMRSWCGMVQPESLLEDLIQFMDGGPRDYHATLSHKRPRGSLVTQQQKIKGLISISLIDSNLLALHQIATLRHDELGQETLLNLLLRNFLHYNLYDQAEKLKSKAPRFEAHSNQQASHNLVSFCSYEKGYPLQFCRYLFNLGKIRTIQLEYTDAKECLLQAVRKAPVAALGFWVQCNKWAIIVRLLLGEIPERIVFM
ncbi:UBX domain-containing protein isoform 2 [Hibiscus syriacus]|uniref:UBX domain-containing protein isoform 2 n=1 Tax=Hibiscus syriacus TaxID=106335 RepID=A0A6A2Z8E1_HIBSY|nr:UBX domain-containing protein isoform 2 [Hibiscus syriacus]